MYISHLKLDNYRGIKSVQSIPFSEFSSIVGKNDAGKSILLHAIASFLNLKEYPISETDFNNDEATILIQCSFKDRNLLSILENHLQRKLKKSEGLEEFLKDLVIKDSITIRKIIKKGSKSFNSIQILMRDFEHSEFSDIYRKDDDMLNVLIKKYSIVIPAKGMGRNSRLEKIKYIKQYCVENSFAIIENWVEDIYNFNDILPNVELFQSDYGLEADTKFKTNSVSEIQDFFDEKTADEDSSLNVIARSIKSEMKREAESIKSYMTNYTSALKDVVITPNIIWKDAVKSVDVSFQFEGDAKPIPMSHKGTGYRRLFMVARFRYLAEKKGKNIVYLIEEPETFLHPGVQEDLLTAFLELSETSQILITTHSPIFVGSTNYKSVVLCTREFESKYETVADSSKLEFSKKIINELGIKPYHNLEDEFTKILFVESPNDCKFIEQICIKCLGKSMLSNERILCLPCGGDSIDSFLNILYFDRTNRDLFLVIDSDKQNTVEKQREQIARKEEFISKEKHFGYILNKSCIENYYSPRAIERVYGLEANSITSFQDDENVAETLRALNKEKNLHIKLKNNFDIFNEMTTEEWNSVIEADLITFLTKLFE